jgi:hypothetical protein
MRAYHTLDTVYDILLPHSLAVSLFITVDAIAFSHSAINGLMARELDNLR